ncbi:MAG: hypothetical protein LKE39_00910 [Sphaerochaeta sp.]|jgi:hypothetical protein|nr:hypothetical protein [Sphaerochaeta sp.]MCH3919058.1 hypothetical protein [Sphaerochaeta sp.]
MKKKLIFVLLIACSLATVFASSEKWEYMVVSFGKSYFSDYNVRALAYLDEGIRSDVQEAKSIEKSLDVLGQHGWEVIDITGTIGGDQQITLKRPYNKEVSDAEKILALEQQQKLDKDALSLAEYLLEHQEQEPEPPKPKELKDLDAIEAEAAKEAKIEEKISSMKKALQTAMSGTELVLLKETYNYEPTKQIDVMLEVLVPQRFLIGDDSYRKSEINSYAQSLSKVFQLKEFESENGSSIKVRFFLACDGVNQRVGYNIYSYYFSSYRKTGEWSIY